MNENGHSIIRAVLSGEKEAYGLLVERHSPVVFRVAFRLTGNEADAEEIVQETFLRGYRQLEKFRFRSDFGTWIYRIAVNCALDRLNGRGIEAAYRVGEETIPERREAQVAANSAGPERLLLSREIDAAYAAAVQRLTPAERAAFILRHMEGCSTEEIARVLGIASNAAKQAVFRAIQKLRQELAPLKGKA